MTKITQRVSYHTLIAVELTSRFDIHLRAFWIVVLMIHPFTIVKNTTIVKWYSLQSNVRVKPKSISESVSNVTS